MIFKFSIMLFRVQKIQIEDGFFETSIFLLQVINNWFIMKTLNFWLSIVAALFLIIPLFVFKRHEFIEYILAPVAAVSILGYSFTRGKKYGSIILWSGIAINVVALLLYYFGII